MCTHRSSHCSRNSHQILQSMGSHMTPRRNMGAPGSPCRKASLLSLGFRNQQQQEFPHISSPRWVNPLPFPTTTISFLRKISTRSRGRILIHLSSRVPVVVTAIGSLGVCCTIGVNIWELPSRGSGHDALHDDSYAIISNLKRSIGGSIRGVNYSPINAINNHWEELAPVYRLKGLI